MKRSASVLAVVLAMSLAVVGAAMSADRQGTLTAGQVFRDCPECPEMVVVPAGSFEMGSPSSEAGRECDEGPVHRVVIGEPFAVGVKEVTRGEYGRFVRATGRLLAEDLLPCFWSYEYVHGRWQWTQDYLVPGGTQGFLIPGVPKTLWRWRNWEDPGFEQTDEHPVVCVDGRDARAYVRWLSDETGEEYRLLRESEWKYVNRRESPAVRYWGASDVDQCRYLDSKSIFGAMKFSRRYFRHYCAGTPSDGGAWEARDCIGQMIGCASWHYGPRYRGSPMKTKSMSGMRISIVGFRIARTLTPRIITPLPRESRERKPPGRITPLQSSGSVTAATKNRACPGAEEEGAGKWEERFNCEPEPAAGGKGG